MYVNRVEGMCMMKWFLYLLLFFTFVAWWSTADLQAQTTGKIAGFVTDAGTNEPLPGANVLVEGTSMGASTGLDGSFYIINVRPGTYTVTVQMIGYATEKITDLRVSVNRTASLSITLKPTIMEGEVIVVQADKIATKKDQTGSMRTISSEQMEVLPIENMTDVVSMQAGVVQGHFRGGRITEVSYLIDGMQVDDALSGEFRNVDIEPEAIQDLEVNTGTFNAEYGRAMSGVVNAVTKDGGNDFTGSFSTSLANYYTSHDDIFIGLDDTEINRNQDYKFFISGPIVKNRLNFFLNTRYQDNKNHLNGIRRFNMNDFSSYAQYPDFWYSEVNGDSSYVPMNNSKNLSILGKLTYRAFESLKMSLLYTKNLDEWHNYDHAFKYAPDGRAFPHRDSDMLAFQLNHAVSTSAFYEFKLSYLDNYDGYYLYENPLSPKYVSDVYLGNNAETGFFTGGQQKDHNESTQIDWNAKFDFTWQVNSKHSLKLGWLYTHHNIRNRNSTIFNTWADSSGDREAEFYFDENGKIIFPNYNPVIKSDTTIYTDAYHVKPTEFSFYLQDKMEYEDMVLNVGLRLDYFDPASVYPSNYRNPGANSFYQQFDTTRTVYKDADYQVQVSPRIGLSYQLGRKAVLHFAYGHFFQIPPMYAMYANSAFQMAPNDFETPIMGDTRLKAQKTIQYEIGLWQELMDGMGLEVTLFYRDIYDLLSTKVITHYNQTRFGVYTNKDYGNAKGLEVTYDYRYQSWYAAINYTLQYTRGNADSPTQTFNRAGGRMDPVDRLIPMSWDQRHTFNATVGYNQPNYGGTLTGYYNSGSIYSWSPVEANRISKIKIYPNNDYRASSYTVDLNAWYQFVLFKDIKLKLNLSVYNLLDRLNEAWVYPRTGQAYTDIILPSDVGTHRSDFNEYEDRIENPSMYSAPRLIKLGMGVTF